MTDIHTIERKEADRISDILVGGVDPHVHSGPSIAPRAIASATSGDTAPCSVITSSETPSNSTFASFV